MMPFTRIAIIVAIPFVESMTEKIKNPKEAIFSYLRVIYLLSYRRVPSRISKDVSRFFIERVLRASRSKRVTTLQLRCISGFWSDNNRHSSRNFADIVARFVRRLFENGVLFSAWHQRILLVTEEACAVIVWEIRCQGNDRSQNGYEVAVARGRCFLSSAGI